MDDFKFFAGTFMVLYEIPCVLYAWQGALDLVQEIRGVHETKSDILLNLMFLGFTIGTAIAI